MVFSSGCGATIAMSRRGRLPICPLDISDFPEREMVANMGIEIGPQGVGEDQPVIDFLRDLFVNIGAATVAKGGAECMRTLVIADLFEGAGLDIGHAMITKK